MERSRKQQQKQQVIHLLFRRLCARNVLSDKHLRKRGAEIVTITQSILQVIVNLFINIIVIGKAGYGYQKIFPLCHSKSFSENGFSVILRHQYYKRCILGIATIK